jgi:streptogramin lyase
MGASKLIRAVAVVVATGLAVAGLVAQAPASGTISGRVTADKGDVRALRVSAKDTVHKVTYTVFMHKGEYSIYNLPPSSYDVFVVEDAFDSPVQKVDVKGGDAKAADIALKAKTGPVPDMVPGGRPRPNAELVDWDTIYPPSPTRDLMDKQCFTCHSFVGFHRRGGKTEAQWRNAVERMFDNKAWNKNIGIEGAPKLDAQLPADQKEAIVKYLAANFPIGGKVRDLKLDPLVRDEDALAETVYVMYELPPVQGGDFANGKAEIGFHDAFPGRERDTLGTVWLSGTPNGTLWQVDVRRPEMTAEQRTKQFRIPFGNNENIRPHGLFEFKNKVYTSNLSNAGVSEFDTKTHQFRQYEPVESKGSGGLTVVADSKGNVWWANNMGHTRIVRLDAATKKITEYNPVPGAGWYGINVDKKDRIFAAGYGGGFDVPMYDPKTDKWTLFHLDHTNRRPTIDSKNLVWTSQYYGNSIGMVDPASGKTMEFKLPLRYGNPYEVSADTQDNVWSENQNYNSLVKFDQKTKRFTYFPFPVLRGHTPKINRDEKGDAWFGLEDELTVFRPNGNKPSGKAVQRTAQR